jgi:hypothetical protein
MVFSRLYAAKGPSEDSEKIVFIPFVRDEQHVVNATLRIIMTPKDTTFKLLYDWQYKDTVATGMGKRGLALLLMSLDKNVFGNRLFLITDSSLFGDSDRRAKYIRLDREPQAKEIKAKYVYHTLTVCYSQFVPANQAQVVGCPPDSPDCNGYVEEFICVSESWLSWEDDDGGGISPPPTDPGNGGGGGTGDPGGGWEDPCPGGPVQPRGEFVQPCGGDPGWQPMPPDNGGTIPYSSLGYHHFDTWDVSGEDYAKIQNWNLNNIDTTGLDSCIKKVLDKILNSNNSIGKLLTKMERSIFKSPNLEKFQVVFRASSSLPATTEGQTEPGHYNTSTGIFLDTILLNQRVIDSATEIGVARTIVHELVHCYLKSIFFRWFYSDYTPTYITGMPIDTLFNKYIDSMVVINTANGLNSWGLNDPEKDHSYMADHFLQAFSDMLKSVDDSRNSDEYYWLQSWSGLWHSRTMNYYWPNFPNWPPSNPAPSNDSTWGLKYALTQARLDSLTQSIYREVNDTSNAKGRKRNVNDCYH